MFELHSQLANDCIEVGDLTLCKVLLLNDRLYPWLILVPRREGVSEIFQLTEEDQIQLLTESSAVGKALMAYFSADKLNVAALGNMVPQLHVHHVLRYKTDPMWPKPVWGGVVAEPYNTEQLVLRMAEVREQLLPLGLSC